MVCLVLAMLLVFIGTLAQVEMGLYAAQNAFFRSFVVLWGPAGAGWKIPVFPGGYLIGGVLLINLLCSLLRIGLNPRKGGIILIHIGLILLLVGQLATDLLSTEATMHIREGEVKNYSEVDRRTELAVVDVSAADLNTVVTIPDSLLRPGAVIARRPELPFTVRVKRFLPNSSLRGESAAGYEKGPASQGFGPELWLREERKVTTMDSRDMPSAVIELEAEGKSLGTWLVSTFIGRAQTAEFGGKTYELSLRSRRQYKPFSLELLDFRHDVYSGTTIPKNFSSEVRLRNAATGEDREVKIYMNNPLRYGGLTFYQASFDPDNQGTVLQVVRNPGWLTPYLGTVVVGLGLLVQFLSHLIPFVKRKAEA